MPAVHVRLDLLLPRFAYSACGPFTRNKEIQKFEATRDSRHIFQNELDSLLSA